MRAWETLWKKVGLSYANGNEDLLLKGYFTDKSQASNFEGTGAGHGNQKKYKEGPRVWKDMMKLGDVSHTVGNFCIIQYFWLEVEVEYAFGKIHGQLKPLWLDNFKDCT